MTCFSVYQTRFDQNSVHVSVSSNYYYCSLTSTSRYSASKYAVRNILRAKLGHNISLEVMSYLLYFINWVFASHILLHLKKLEKSHPYAQFTRTNILRCDLLFSCANLIKTMGWRWGGFLLTLRERGASINYLVLSGWVFHKHEEPHAFLE